LLHGGGLHRLLGRNGLAYGQGLLRGNPLGRGGRLRGQGHRRGCGLLGGGGLHRGLLLRLLRGSGRLLGWRSLGLFRGLLLLWSNLLPGWRGGRLLCRRGRLLGLPLLLLGRGGLLPGGGLCFAKQAGGRGGGVFVKQACRLWGRGVGGFVKQVGRRRLGGAGLHLVDEMQQVVRSLCRGGRGGWLLEQ